MPSIIRCDKLGDYKSSASKFIPHISQARAKKKLSEEAKPKVFRFIQTCRQIEIHTHYTSS
jgi:hypothetical protein